MLRFDELLLDCEQYNGYKPCRYGNRCGGCVHYRPLQACDAGEHWMPVGVAGDVAAGEPVVGRRVLIIKTGALGDVLRTTTLLPNLHRTYNGVEVTWITDQAAIPLLAATPLIKEVVAIQDRARIGTLIDGEVFDLLISLEKEQEPLLLAARVRTRRAVGFAPTPFGKPTVFNREARLGLLLGLDDDLKFRQNTKSYPQIVAEMCGLVHQRDRYVLEMTPEAVRARTELRNLAGKPVIIGLNTGCGTVFRTKQWLENHWLDLARRLSRRDGCRVVMLGGPAEAQMNRRILEALPDVLDGGANRPLSEFIGVVDACDLVVSSDTLGMHIAIARERPVIALFGSTSATEIDLYDRGEKVVTDFPCAPCYKRSCDFDPWCMERLMPEQVEAAVLRWLPAVGR